MSILFISSSPIQREPLYSILFGGVAAKLLGTRKQRIAFFFFLRKKVTLCMPVCFGHPAHLTFSNNNRQQRKKEKEGGKRNFPNCLIAFSAVRCMIIFLFSFPQKGRPRADESEEHPTKLSKRNAWSVGLVYGKSSTDHSPFLPFLFIHLATDQLKQIGSTDTFFFCGFRP